MSSDDEGYIVSPNPSNPSQPIKSKVLRFKKIKGEDYEYVLDDGTKIKLIIDMTNITRPIDPNTKKLSRNPLTKEPIINITWGVRVMTTYSEKALEKINGDEKHT